MSPRILSGLVLALLMAFTAERSGVAQPKSKPSFEAAANKLFAKRDKNKNGELSIEELDAILTNPKFKGERAAAAAVMRMAAIPGDKADAPRVFNAKFATSKPETGKPSLDERFAAALYRIEKADRRLFVPGGPRLDTLHQGAIGDCFALAPFGALLARDPKAVTNMMSELPGGRYRVAFADKTLEIDAFTDGEFAMSGGWTENSGCWVRVYEKALGQYMREQMGTSSVKSLATDVIAEGGNAGPVITALTGHDTMLKPLAKLRNPSLNEAKRTTLFKELREALTAANNNKRLMTLSVPGGDSATGAARVPGVNQSHAYAVLAFDSKIDLLTIWNPHGDDFIPMGKEGIQNGYTTKDGVFKAPLGEVVKWAGRIIIETDKPASTPTKK